MYLKKQVQLRKKILREIFYHRFQVHKQKDVWVLEKTALFLGFIPFSFLFCFVFGCTTLHSMWDLSSPTRDGTWAPCSGSAES